PGCWRRCARVALGLRGSRPWPRRRLLRGRDTTACCRCHVTRTGFAKRSPESNSGCSRGWGTFLRGTTPTSSRASSVTSRRVMPPSRLKPDRLKLTERRRIGTALLTHRREAAGGDPEGAEQAHVCPGWAGGRGPANQHAVGQPDRGGATERGDHHAER